MLRFYMFLFLLRRADGVLLYADPGQNVTLQCVFAQDAVHLSWYKQVAGEQPQIVSFIYQSSRGGNRFHGQFKDDNRFSVHTGEGVYHLKISDVQDSDSAMYYCGQTSITVTQFNEGVYLVLKESSHRSYILQPKFHSVKSGGSTTLKCFVHNGICDVDHSVYWFKKDSGNSHAGIMYIHANSSRQCGPSRRPEPPEQRCEYRLPKRDVSQSDAGTYYCAVAHCGDILFGNGTRLHVRNTEDVLLYCVAAALLLSVILNIILICILGKTSRKNRPHSEGLQLQPSIQEFTADSQSTDVDALQYVALDFKKRQSNRGQRGTEEEETIYSGVRRT